jgi:hypothetical protein
VLVGCGVRISTVDPPTETVCPIVEIRPRWVTLTPIPPS